MQIERLRLAGFKSFVEPTELTIEPGLTGIVGPNGCGKSNLVEALRWVMGEASARRLRGGEMDDVIFGGSGGRPARNIAEVALTLDNSERDAPFAFNEGTTIEVARRITRGSGSVYRVNGREARAHDVQLLFADAASGPHSGALVGQGRVGGLIAAKPGERRLLLDEAAGTAGLHARRHEAELKLQGAEANLARLDDVVAALAAQIETLNKQARQARRYRRLGEQIRRIEVALLHARWQAAATESEGFATALRAAERDLAAATETAVACDRERSDADQALPPLRMAQAAAAAALQRLTHAREALEQELKRVIAAKAETERRLAQLAGDAERETERLADADAALARLAEEGAALRQAEDAAVQTQQDAAAQAAAAASALATAETGLQQMTEACATDEARRAALGRQRRDLADRERRLRAQLADSERQREPLLAALLPAESIVVAGAEVAAAAAAIDDARNAASAASETLAGCQKREGSAADSSREAERVLARLKAESDALSRLAAPAQKASKGGEPILAQLRVPPGFEAAAAALFDGELAAPELPAATDQAEAGWLALPPLAAVPLPEGARPLAGEIAAPAALDRRLAFAGCVDSAADGWRLQPQLAAGQSLVDRDGRLWRWDGFARLAAGSTATAERLRQRNRLERLAQEIAKASAEAARAGEIAAACRAAREAAAAAERHCVLALRAAEDRLAAARKAEAELSQRALAAQTRLAAATAALEKLAADLTETGAQAADLDRQLNMLPDPALARGALDAAREETAAARRRENEARAALDRLIRDAEARRQRLAVIAVDEASWRKRRDAAAAQGALLAERRANLVAEIAALSGRPAAIAIESDALAQQTATSALERQRADDALAVGETRLRTATEAARQAEAAVAEARERRAGLEARRDAAATGLQRLRAEIAERLDAPPEDLAALVAAEGGAEEAGHTDDLAARLDRLMREREGIGPVNLLAEQEATEVTDRLASLERERGDLTAAIARLRRGVAALDREARARLVAAFDLLNGHFGELFARLFGGGKAELAWTGDDDPLEAGLDILASPPGKRLDSLTLLSGGEQALTALALIFAVFLTNPAPICVLDEVDAPLDDNNVDAFCRLVADIADASGTRFLLVTHHRVTMARMDRLFGVTMAERGVSQLVSVDLARATELRQSA